MNVDLQRAIDRYLGVPLCALASLLERVLPRRTPQSLPRRIVVILLSEMGSLVLAQPMFALLRCCISALQWRNAARRAASSGPMEWV